MKRTILIALLGVFLVVLALCTYMVFAYVNRSVIYEAKHGSVVLRVIVKPSKGGWADDDDMIECAIYRDGVQVEGVWLGNRCDSEFTSIEFPEANVVALVEIHRPQSIVVAYDTASGDLWPRWNAYPFDIAVNQKKRIQKKLDARKSGPKYELGEYRCP